MKWRAWIGLCHCSFRRWRWNHDSVWMVPPGIVWSHSTRRELALGLNWFGASLGLRWWRICLPCRSPGFDPWVQKIPWRREWLLTPMFLWIPWTEELGRLSPWSHEELDTTQQLTLSLLFTLNQFQEDSKSRYFLSCMCRRCRLTFFRLYCRIFLPLMFEVLQWPLGSLGI